MVAVRSAFTVAHVLVSCEHASNRIPARYANLGLGRAALASHIAWDCGAAIMARLAARRLGCPCHLGRWSRLVVDLNRRPGHPKLIAPRSFGVDVPGNRDLSRHEHERRSRLYHASFRERALADIRRIIAARGACMHLSVHSFTPVVAGEVRRADVGLLYDPSRAREKAFAQRLAPLLSGAGLHVRMNYPYRGTSDGFTTACRSLFPAARYAALEIETNQKLLPDAAQAQRLGRLFADCLVRVLS